MALSGLMIVLISSADRQKVDFYCKLAVREHMGCRLAFHLGHPSMGAALAAAAVLVTGGIAFVGLRAPHFARALVGFRNQLFLPVAILICAWLLLLADTIGRNILEPKGIPAGIMIALIGASYIMYLLMKK